MPITLKNENLQRREFFFPKEKHFFASKDVTSTVISHSFEENPKDAAGWQKKALKWKIVGKSETDWEKESQREKEGKSERERERERKEESQEGREERERKSREEKSKSWNVFDSFNCASVVFLSLSFLLRHGMSWVFFISLRNTKESGSSSTSTFDDNNSSVWWSSPRRLYFDLFNLVATTNAVAAAVATSKQL